MLFQIKSSETKKGQFKTAFFIKWSLQRLYGHSLKNYLKNYFSKTCFIHVFYCKKNMFVLSVRELINFQSRGENSIFLRNY